MSTRSWIKNTLDLQPVSHRPPLTSRFWVYSASAFLLPVVAQIVIPEDPGLTDELIWLVTLVPAFLLSLHYGIRGAFVALMMGTALFVVVQAVVAFNFTPDDWRITVPIYVAYGTLAISVGSLSEQLHGYYRRALQNERMAAIGEVAVTIQHELNNALTIVVTESQLMESDAANLNDEQRESVRSIQNAGIRMAAQVERLANLADAPVTTYSSGIRMLDLDAASVQKRGGPAAH
jgi:signal transduction histidine kinase